MNKTSYIWRFFAIIIVVLFVAQPSHAVLKEKNLDNTLTILRGELTDYHLELEKETKKMQDEQKYIWKQLMSYMSRSSQNSLMLYSQKRGYIFDLTYACHEATEMYTQFQNESKPFRSYLERNASEIARYDSLITTLSQMPVMLLDDKAKIDRSVCLTLAINIRRTLNTNNEEVSDYVTYYERTEERLKHLNDYAMERYSEIQNNIFVNGGDNYFNILSKFGTSFDSMHNSVVGKYASHTSKIRSQWSVSSIFVLFIILLVYGVIAFALSLLGQRFLMPKRFKTEWYLSRKKYIAMATSTVLLAILLAVARVVAFEHNFFVMASGLLIEYCWLVSVILISLMLRLESNIIKNAIRIYAPLVAMGLIVISFRIVLIPNDLVNLIFPPILLACTIWQWVAVLRHNEKIPRSDMYYSYISLVVFIFSVACSWVGYTLFSVQALIWWIMQLTCILTITCISGWMEEWARTKFAKKKKKDVGIAKTWFYDFCQKVILPTLAVCSLVLAVYWAADVFNLSDTTWTIFKSKFINTPNFSASIYGLSIVVVLYFLFAYINHTVKAALHEHFEASDHTTAASRDVLARNIVQIIVWGIWLLISLSILQVSTTWLAVITAGLSTGLGFASKDILENIYYGISLMAGRVKIGDYIECDGYRGTVDSINYTSTMMSVADGSVIAFQNSQLFTKNYKNLTKNHGYQLSKIDIGVAYGSDIRDVRRLLKQEVGKFEFLKKNSEVTVVLNEFGDSSVNLTVMCWVPVITYYICNSQIRECIYQTLNDNSIEIPFPQVDLHQRP